MSVVSLDEYDIVRERHQLDQSGGGGYIDNTFRVGNLDIRNISSINIVDKNYTFEYDDKIRTVLISVNDNAFGTYAMFHYIPKGGGDISTQYVNRGELDRGPTTVYLDGDILYINGQDTSGNYYVSIDLTDFSNNGGPGHVTTGDLLDNTAISDGGFDISGDSSTYVQSGNDTTIAFMKFTQ